ncbi:MAG: peptidoglycan-binding protein [Eubacteriales bacterium]|nr:peptidoglycan-binding protein [Eubacteriales bacterium]
MKRNRLKNKRIRAALLITGVCLALTSCRNAEVVEEITEATPPMEIEIIGVDTSDDVLIIQAAPDAAVLPDMAGVTTAENNAVLSPLYLKVGDESPVVIKLQEKLMKLGYMDDDEPTVYYGPATAEAVKKFQRQTGGVQDGIVGTETWDRLFSNDTPFYLVKNGDSGDDILHIQQRLYQLGYITESSVTGYFGDATESGVKLMQKRNNISIDGTVGLQSINLLYSEDIVANLIGLGDKSDVVKKYQQRLILLGYLYDEADGTFGRSTQKAIMQFQSMNGQIVDGYLGPDTRAALDSDMAKPFGLRLGDRSDYVTEVQQRLVHYGYLKSKHVTGYYGELTQNAVKVFQECNSLTPDGTAGIKTITKLKSDNATKKPANVSVPETVAATTAAATTAPPQTQAGGQTGGQVTQTQAPQQPVQQEIIGAAAQNLINIAKSKLGCSYVWGSKGPNSFDCSGFVYWCLNQAGISQSYITSSGWRNPGRYSKVSNFDDIRAGDIIVTSGHVGIAAGNGTVIDASSSNGRVVHRSLSDWWRSRFIVAWRIF